MTDTSNTANIINSRDVIARIKELQGERDDYEPRDAGIPADAEGWAEENPDDAEELAALESLREQAEGYSDWTHGAQLIRDSYFEEHARELAEDFNGAATRVTEWPFTCIDWERAARELRQDYTAVEYDGATYWVRS